MIVLHQWEVVRLSLMSNRLHMGGDPIARFPFLASWIYRTWLVQVVAASKQLVVAPMLVLLLLAQRLAVHVGFQLSPCFSSSCFLHEVVVERSSVFERAGAEDGVPLLLVFFLDVELVVGGERHSCVVLIGAVAAVVVAAVVVDGIVAHERVIVDVEGHVRVVIDVVVALSIFYYLRRAAAHIFCGGS